MTQFKTIRNRIKELRYVNSSQLIHNKKNWRMHPIAQRETMMGVLDTIGYADALIARETEDGSLVLIDGHLRAETTPDQEVPVLVLDITERESDMLLATLDPIAEMAGRDELKLKDLLESIEVGNEAVHDLLTSLAGDFEPLLSKDDWKEEWEGMPEFVQDDAGPYRSVNIHFRNEADIQTFKETIGQDFTDKAKSVWFPPLRDDERNDNSANIYIDENSK